MQKNWALATEKIIEDWDDFQELILNNRQLTETDLEVENSEVTKITAAEVGIDPLQLEKALAKIIRAEENNQEVVIFGDYDVDGNCATAIMWQGLREIGLTAIPFIPHRLRHGYGIRVNALEEIFATKKPDLIITVDNGITADAALEFCHAQKVPVIITDHHLRDQKKEKLRATAVVQTTQLCGAGVAWVVIKELWKKTGVKNWGEKTRELLDLVCLATIADQVPLKGVNRQLARAGLEQLRQSQRPGLVELIKISALKQKSLSTDDVGFGLGPKINAIGRLTNTLEALRLLCTTNQKKALELAQVLTKVNGQRQELTGEMIDLALKQVGEKELPKVILVASNKFHEGIVGLIASKLTEIYARPTVAISLDDKIGKASCRSIEGINITQLLRTFREDLIDVGGHEMAAGFSFKRENLELVKKSLQKAAAVITNEQLVPKIIGDGEVKMAILYEKQLSDFLNQLQPFGAGNAPITVVVAGKVISWRYLGNENQHLRLDLADETGKSLTVLFWQYEKNKIEIPGKGAKIRVIGELKIDEYQGRKTPRIFAKDLKIN